MAWKTFILYEPHNDDASKGVHPIEDQLSQIEANGYEIRFVFKESARYTVLARLRAH